MIGIGFRIGLALALIVSVAAAAEAPVPEAVPIPEAPAPAASPVAVPSPRPRVAVPRVRSASCVGAAELTGSDLKAYARFAAVRGLLTEWKTKDCYPPRLDDAALAQAPSAVGQLVGIHGKEAFVVEPDPYWIQACDKPGEKRRGFRPEVQRLSGYDLLAVKQQVETFPALTGYDILEIGFSRAEAGGGRQLFALYLGTADRAARIECFEEILPLLSRTAEALAGGRN